MSKRNVKPAKERVLKSRKRKPASKGHVIRVSDLVLSCIDEQRRNRRRLSHDAYLREVFGLPSREDELQWIRDGRPALKAEVWIDGFLLPGQNSGAFYAEEKDANGAAIQAFAKKLIKKFMKPIKMREV